MKDSTSMDYDFVIIGSGFGGSVAALRLAERGYKTAVLEQGKVVTPEDVARADESPLRNLMWAPGLGMGGWFWQRNFRHVSVVGGAGVGGGSLVYAAVLLKPKPAFFDDAAWNHLGVNWSEELAPHFDTASKMLGVVTNPYHEKMDTYLQQTAEKMGAAHTFGPTPNGIYFGKPGVTADDPFFDGAGPSRTGCQRCGDCMTGCGKNAKNSLDKNYLYLAQRLGVDVLPERKVTEIVPEPGGYRIRMVHPLKPGKPYADLRCAKVVLAAGVLGTLELLFHCRDVAKTLPGLSQQLGRVVRTNSESIVSILSKDVGEDITKGSAISSHFHPDDHTHITQNRFPPGYSFMRWQIGPMVDEANPTKRALKVLAAFFTSPLRSTISFRARNWLKRLSVLTVMQHLDNQIQFTHERSAWPPFKRKLVSVAVPGKEAPAYIPVANQAARAFAEVSGGVPTSSLMESVGNMAVTAHIMGGVHMGKTIDDGVIDTRHEVFGYPGLYVTDASAISANVGVNPSLTIAAQAERAMSFIARNDRC